MSPAPVPALQEFGFLPLNTFSRTADPVLVPSHSFQGDSQPNPDPEQPTPAPEHDLRHTQTRQATNSFVTQGKAVSPEKLHIEHGCIVLELFSGKESPPGTQGTPQEPPGTHFSLLASRRYSPTVMGFFWMLYWVKSPDWPVTTCWMGAGITMSSMSSYVRRGFHSLGGITWNGITEMWGWCRYWGGDHLEQGITEMGIGTNNVQPGLWRGSQK